MTEIAELLRPTRQCTCSSLRQASRAVTQHYEASFRGAGIRATQFTILSMLAQTGPTPMARLAARLGLERTTLTRNLKPLLARGLVALSGEADGRVRCAAITGSGEAMARENFQRWQAAQATVHLVIDKFPLGLPRPS
ncbi:MAG: hypothetical protein JWO51_2197 [Rhodospirillales bacterium]|nr:hypothetical protein [Rhodospirillales bacterium]